MWHHNLKNSLIIPCLRASNEPPPPAPQTPQALTAHKPYSYEDVNLPEQRLHQIPREFGSNLTRRLKDPSLQATEYLSTSKQVARMYNRRARPYDSTQKKRDPTIRAGLQEGRGLRRIGSNQNLNSGRRRTKGRNSSDARVGSAAPPSPSTSATSGSTWGERKAMRRLRM